MKFTPSSMSPFHVSQIWKQQQQIIGPITVTSPIMCLYTSILSATLVEFTEQHSLRAESQTGLRPELATTHQLLEVQHFIIYKTCAHTLTRMLPGSSKAGVAWTYACAWCLEVFVQQ